MLFADLLEQLEQIISSILDSVLTGGDLVERWNPGGPWIKKIAKGVKSKNQLLVCYCEEYGETTASRIRGGVLSREVLKTKGERQEREMYPDESRWMAMKLIQEKTEMTLWDLAERFQVGSYSAISTTVGKLNKLMGSDGKILAEYELLRAEIAEK